MTTPQITEERLRNYLDGNQPARERLCIAILNMDRRFSDVRPRHPKGGPDGGRDIEAKYRDTELTYGAAGFVNGANDSEAQIKQIKAKFKADLQAALREEVKPTAFVFFTNVALTAGEKAALVKAATKAGVTECDIFDRERLRVALDGTDGLGARVQYLDIPMSSAEQASFFARWGDDIQSLVASRFQSVESTLSRLLFLQEARATLKTISVRFILDRTYTGKEIGHFRAFVSFFFPKMRHGLTEALFGSTDKSRRFSAHPYRGRPEPSGIAHGVSDMRWESRLKIKGDPEDDDAEADYVKYVPHGSGSGIGAKEVKQIVVSYHHTDTFDFQFLPRLSLEDIQGAWVMPNLNATLAEKLDAIEIWADGYVLMSLERSDFSLDRSPTEFPVPGHFSDQELADPWVRIRPSGFSSNLTIDFTRQTPKRAYVTKEMGGPIKR
ncbi:MAG: hypothetical protein ACK4MH_04055 [Brevundimonas sp.]|uniref:hypothetical protein n=1 Tax=Brevundimonas sp. TaxID=1871086 RepID=UPI00391D4027